MSIKQIEQVRQYLIETEHVPEMKYLVNRDFMEHVYDSLDFKLWYWKKELKSHYKSFLRLFNGK